MKVQTILLFVFVFFTLSCHNLKEDKFSIIIRDKPVFETILAIRMDSVSLKETLNIWYWKIDSTRVSIFAPSGNEHFLFVYSLPDFELLHTYGKVGQGPGEYVTVNWGNSNIENQIILYDMMKKNLYSLTVHEDGIKTNNTFTLYGADESDGYAKPFTMIHQLNDSVYLMKAEMTDNSYLELVDLKNNHFIFSQENEVKRSPDKGASPYNYEVECTDSLLITAFNYIDRIEFISLTEDLRIRTHLILGENEVKEDHLSISQLNNYYTDIKCDGEFVYAVYQNGASELENSSIEIYDLLGNAIQRVDLDQYIELIMISKTSDIIYGYNSMEEGDYIYMYRNPVY